MKINYKNYPTIKSIHDKNFNFLINNDDIDFVKKNLIPNVFRENAKHFSKINLITKPFLKSLDLCIGKLWENMIGTNFSDSGTFVIKRDDGVLETYCFHFELKDKSHPFLVFYYFQNEMLIKYLNIEHDVSYCYDKALSNNTISYQDAIQHELDNLIKMSLFTKYSQIETKVLNPKQKVTNIICLYKNETDLKINILDSKWFTNLVKSDGFNVRGHFRLQPKKSNGEWTKELIWIADFQKTGYTAPARMLSTNN